MSVLVSDGGENLSRTLHHILDTFAADIDCSRGVFLKPNIVFPVKEGSGEITPLAVAETLVATLRERQSDVDVVIGEGVAAGRDPQENFRVSGYAELARKLGVPLMDLDRADRRAVPWEFGQLQLPEIALDRVYINLPILKPSSACTISGALKNQKGLLLPEVKKAFHRLGLQERVSELNAAVRPSLTIMDCSRFFGRGVFISGNNCGEIDATACELLGIDEPEHVALARNAGLFSSGYAVQGDRSGLALSRPCPEDAEFKRIGRLRLWSNPQACTGCRYVFRDIERNLLHREQLLAAAKMLPYLVGGAEIIMGRNAQWRREYDTVICVGACTRRVAEEGGHIYIPGCPPTPTDFCEHLPSFREKSLSGDAVDAQPVRHLRPS